MAAALAFAHRHGVVHRDVKPGNVLITPDGEVKVTDFGIARAVNTEESLTQTGAVMGTAAYFSPEQAEGKGVDARSDIYSLGVVLYEMAVGRPPFTGDSPVAVASKHVRDRPVLPASVNPAVPAALEAIIMKAMAKDPDDRYGSAEELRADLLRFADGRPVEAGDPGVTSMMAARSGPPRPSPSATGRTRAVPAGAGSPTRRRARSSSARSARAGSSSCSSLLLVALGVIAFFLLRSVLTVSNVTVPNVVGRPRRPATQTLQNDDLDRRHAPSSRPTRRPRATCSRPTPPRAPRCRRTPRSTWWSATGPNIPIVTVPTGDGQAAHAGDAADHRRRALATPVKYVTSNQAHRDGADPEPGRRGQGQVERAGGRSPCRAPRPRSRCPACSGSRPRRPARILSRCRPERGHPDQRVLEPVPGRAGVVAEPRPPGDNVPAQHAGQPRHLERQLRHGARRGRADGQSAAQAAITGAGPGGQHHLRHAPAPAARSPGTVDSQSPGCGHAGAASGSTVTISVCQANDDDHARPSTTPRPPRRRRAPTTPPRRRHGAASEPFGRRPPGLRLARLRPAGRGSWPAGPVPRR